MPDRAALPLISVIIPVYNMAGGDRLKWCMDSLVGQTLERRRPGALELIAVDDCSTDNSLELLKAYEERYPELVRVIASPENRRQGGVKNLGLDAARGEWIGFVDSDDWVTPDFYERLLNEAERTGADMAGCDYSLVYEHTMTPGERVANNSEAQTGELNREKYRLLLLDSGSLVVKLYRREIILGADLSWLEEHPLEDDRHGSRTFPEHILYEDNAVACSWMLRAKRFAYIPEPLYFYYQHGESTVHTVSERSLNDRMEAGYCMLYAAESGGYLKEYKQEIEFLFTELFYRNTLFSAMACFREGKRPELPVYFFTKRLAHAMREVFPDFRDNPYYLERIDAEERGFMALHMKSQLLFYIKYRLLWFYRRLRKRA